MGLFNRACRHFSIINIPFQMALHCSENKESEREKERWREKRRDGERGRSRYRQTERGRARAREETGGML
jgi:hypothetical protein